MSDSQAAYWAMNSYGRARGPFSVTRPAGPERSEMRREPQSSWHWGRYRKCLREVSSWTIRISTQQISSYNNYQTYPQAMHLNHLHPAIFCRLSNLIRLRDAADLRGRDTCATAIIFDRIHAESASATGQWMVLLLRTLQAQRPLSRSLHRFTRCNDTPARQLAVTLPPGLPSF